MTVFSEKRAGVLLHPTSLPSGSLVGVDAWLSFMQDCGLSVWQMLPLGIPQSGLSPYQCESAFAANPALVPASCSENGALKVDSEVDWQDEVFCRFRETERFWLRDFALFRILKERFDDAPWSDWPAPYKARDSATLETVRRDHEDRFREICRQQYAIRLEWQRVKALAASKNILLFGDMPIFVAHDSVDVWAHRPLFLLGEDGLPTAVTGVPPDYFAEEGQRWGNPHYDWDAMRRGGFEWWKQRLEAHFRWFDIVRIDHFRGLEAAWHIPAHADTAIDGKWVKVPGEEFLRSVIASLGTARLVAEDLGIITPEVERLRTRFGLPGMSILQFGFDHFDDNPHKPKNIGRDRVVYTGTHDNDTTLGWYRALDDGMKHWVRTALSADDDHIVEALIKSAFDTQATLAIVPMQDILTLGTEARMNVPGTTEGNWTWAFSWSDVPESTPGRIRRWVEESGRLILPAEVV